MKILEIITEEAQRIDPNGTHDEVIRDIQNGEFTVEEMKEYYRTVLKQWLEDSGNDKKIIRLIELLGE